VVDLPYQVPQKAGEVFDAFARVGVTLVPAYCLS
jgi:hypothetical protein